MNSIFKKILLLWVILFTNLLFADGDDIGISVYNAATVHEDSGTMSFTIELSEAPDWCDEVTVNYTTVDGSATAGDDYTSKNGSETFYGACLFPPHLPQTTKTILVNITNTPATYEDDEYLYMNISNSTVGYFLADSSGYGYIIDNNPTPFKLTLHSRSETEQDSDWVLNFTARLNQSAPAGGITIGYQTQNSSAIAGDDYIATSGSITITEGNTDGYIPVTIIGDTIPEPTDTENFKVKITSISQGSVTNTDNEAKGTITDDDTIKIDISSSNVYEGNSSDSNKMVFKIFLAKDYPNIADLTINYTTEDGSDPSATLANSDYTKTFGSVTFTHGDREKIVYVPIIGDDVIESDELLKMVISSSSTVRHTIINGGVTEAEIMNDDGSNPGVDFSTGDVSIEEGNSSTKILNFHFTLDDDALAGSSFDYYTEDYEANVSDNDYTKIDIKTYTIPVGTRDIDIPVTIIGDTNIEEDETFYLKFTNEKHITIHGHTAKGQILNDDGEHPTLSCETTSLSIPEGNSGQKQLEYKFSLDKPATEGVSFEYDTWDDDIDGDGNDNDGDEDTEDEDYTPIPNTKYDINESSTEFSLFVAINGDEEIEKDEIFYLSLYSPTKLNINESCKGIETTIINDDGNLSEFSIEASVTEGTEGDSGTKNLVFTIKLDAPATEDGVSIQYRTLDGTAKDSDNDYEKITATTIIFNSGESNQTLFVKMNGDTKVEDNETFSIELLNPHTATLSEENSSVEFTIINDDEHNDEPFECNSNMYISSSTNRETGATGKMWLHKIDTTQNPFNFQVVNKDGADEIYNATAYNPDDNYIYALYHRELIKLSKTGKVTNLGVIAGLPDRFDRKQLYAGNIYGGYYYVSGRRTKLKELFKINLNDVNRTVTPITLSLKVAIQDFSFSHDGKYLYGIDRKGKFTTIDVSDGTVTQKGIEHTGYEFDSTFSDKNGRFFANDSNGNGFFEFDLNDGSKQFLSNSQPATYNDGANCLNAALSFMDYGDAPISYGKTWHQIANGIYLGDEVDHDIAHFDTIDADGDDINGIDDEDGVTLIDGSDINGTYFDLNSTQQIKVKLAKEAYLKIWIDLGINGHFSDAADLIYKSESLLSAGTHTIEFTLPDGLTTNQVTYLRARVSSNPNLNPVGFVTDGEVEDYAVFFGTGVVPLKGVFNIERTNSGTQPINSDARNAWYSQIVGRDFDYSILFYEEDLSAQKEIDHVSIKIELVNMENNTTIYERYAYIKNTPPVSRIDVTLPADDLATLPATKDAHFRVSYGVDIEGSILQSDCLKSPQECYEELPNFRTNYAKDNFAIRPESFYISIADGGQERKNSRHLDNNISLASGYDYNLTFRATKYGETLPSNGYDVNFQTYFDFNNSGMSSCDNTDPIPHTVNFKDGEHNTLSFHHNNVGNYSLSIQEDNNWTDVDQNGVDCESNQSFTSQNIGDLKAFNIPSGCDIKLQKNPINLTFQPDHFSVNLTMQNLPNSGHDDFIYMSELNSTYSDVAIAFQGEIVAQSENNITTTNFTTGCVATELLLDLNATTISVEGTNKIIHSIADTPINFSRLIRFNNDPDINNLDLNHSLEYINGEIKIDASKFLSGENNGSSILDIRYNLNKHLTEPINPVEVSFHNIEVNSSHARSMAHDNINISSDTHIPIGKKVFIDNRKNFYFAKVVSDLYSYPVVNVTVSPIIKTPLNVDIFCDINITDYCQDRDILNNTSLTDTTRDERGWYLSSNHDGELDGNVTQLDDNPNIVTVRDNLINAEDKNVTLVSGKNNLIDVRVDNCNFNNSTTITISTTPSLEFEPSEYIINCTDRNASQWTGIGQSGNILNAVPKVHKTGKMDW